MITILLDLSLMHHRLSIPDFHFVHANFNLLALNWNFATIFKDFQGHEKRI